jgi:APA family basic amino acid/polyamine antiporter
MSEQTLVRAVGVRALAAGVFNTTVGAGIFVLPAIVAGMLGAGAPVAYLACAGAMAFVVLSFAAAGSRVQEAGGMYAYIGAAFGPWAGFLGGVMVWLSDTLASASVATALAAAVALYVPAVTEGTGRLLFLIAVVGGLAVINVRGVRQGAGFVEAVTVAKLLPLIVFVGVGVFLLPADASLAPAWPEPAALGRTALVLLFAFSGAESVLALSGEVANPARTIPRGLLVALAGITVLYGAIQLVAFGALGSALAESTAAPLADAAGRLGGDGFRGLLLAGTVISMFGYVSAVALSTPRTVFALGRSGVLPSALARIHPTFRTPHVAIATQATILVAVAASGTFAVLAPMASVAVVTGYLATALAAWRLQSRDVRLEAAPFRVSPAVYAAAAAVCLWLLSNAQPWELLLEGGVLAGASAAFWIARRWRG